MTRWTRFAAVGVAGVGVQLVVLGWLTAVCHLPNLMAVVLAVEAAIVHNFFWHERWTWRDRRDAAAAHPIQRLLRFNVVTGAASLAGNAMVTAGLVSLAGLPVLAANLVAVICLAAINFVMADRLIFLTRPAAPTRARLTVKESAAPRIALVSVTGALLMTAGTPVDAATLSQAALDAWTRYVARVEARITSESRGAARFLALDFADPAEAATLRAQVLGGDVVADHVAGGVVDIGEASVSHWRGYVFVPAVSVDDLLDTAALRGRGASYRQDDVTELRVLERRADALRLFLKVRRTALVSVAYNTEHLVMLERYGPDRAASRSTSVRITELRDAGTPHERERPVGQDRGFMWRLQSYWRYQAVAGGVLVELESLTLSRDMSWTLRTVAGPVIDRIARDTVVRTLTSIRTHWGNAR